MLGDKLLPGLNAGFPLTACDTNLVRRRNEKIISLPTNDSMLSAAPGTMAESLPIGTPTCPETQEQPFFLSAIRTNRVDLRL